MSAGLALQTPLPTIHLVDYETEAKWLQARLHGVGASESAALFGVSPHFTLLKLWALKTGKLDPWKNDEEYFDWGHFLEEPIAQRYAAVTGRTIWKGESPYCVAQHPTNVRMFSTPDRWVIDAPDRGTQGLLQVKNAGFYKADEWKDGPPDYIQIQVQHEMAVTGREWASVAVLIGGNKFSYYDIERSPDFIAELEEQVVLFWQLVERQEAPPAEEIDARSLDTLKRLHPADNGAEIVLPDEALEWWATVEQARKTESEVKKLKEDFDAKLRALIGDNTYGRLPDGRRVSLKTSSREGHTVQPTTFRSLKLEKGPRK